MLLVKVKILGETVTVPKPLLKELYKHFARIEEILATLEELMDKEGFERIKKGLEEYKKGEYTTAETIEDIKKALTKD